MSFLYTKTCALLLLHTNNFKKIVCCVRQPELVSTRLPTNSKSPTGKGGREEGQAQGDTSEVGRHWNYTKPVQPKPRRDVLARSWTPAPASSEVRGKVPDSIARLSSYFTTLPSFLRCGIFPLFQPRATYRLKRYAQVDFELIYCL